jgi:NADH-quinone oxidoreductase subunit M
MPFPTTGNELAFPFLTIVLFLPAVGALICSLTTIDWQIRATAGATVVLEFLLSVLLLIIYKSQTASAPGSWQVQFADSHDWISTLGISYLIGVDGVSVFLVPLTALIMGIAVLAATYMINGRVGQFMPLVLLTETAIMGVFLAENLFLFFVFWEAMLIPMYFLVGIWGEERRVYATTKFVVYTVFGSFFMLVAIFYLWSQSNPHTLDMVGSNGLIAQLGAHPLSATQQAWLFLAFGIAFAIKLPQKTPLPST